nr:hypothetical protein [Tanacetum cinerariifolium]
NSAPQTASSEHQTEPSAPETPTPPPPPPTTGHHMTTRSKAGVFKPVHKPNFVPSQRHGLCAALFAASDPRSYKAAAKQR